MKINKNLVYFSSADLANRGVKVNVVYSVKKLYLFMEANNN